MYRLKFYNNVGYFKDVLYRYFENYQSMDFFIKNNTTCKGVHRIDKIDFNQNYSYEYNLRG